MQFRWVPVRVAAATILSLILGTAGSARAQLVAERVTAANAGRLLFGGTDADGGIGDWVLSNGIVQAVIDDVGSQSDLPTGVPPRALQSEASRSGGGVIDLGRVGQHDDQLNQIFTVVGLSTSNFVVYDAVEAEVTQAAAILRVTGRTLGFAPLAPEDLPVVTEYRLAPGDTYLTIHSHVRNLGAVPTGFLGGFIDVMPWTTRALLPFSPLPGRGFHHAVLNIQNPQASLEQPAFMVAPGNVGPEDGMVDPETGRGSGEVSYGLLGVEASFDPDGSGPAPPLRFPVNRLFGASSVVATAFGNLPVTGGLLPGQELRYERRFYVGARNDVASTANPILRELATRLGMATGTLAGDVDGVETAELRANGIATRVGGPPSAEFPVGAPLTHFRTDTEGRFADVVLPVGIYDIELRAPERDPVTVRGVEVVADQETRVMAPPLSGLGRLAFRVVGDVQTAKPGKKKKFSKPEKKKKARKAKRKKGVGKATTLLPARITLLGIDGTADPRFGLEVEALELAVGGAVDLRPETFGSALAQANVVYLARGEGEVALRPGRYEVFASRGPEYAIARQVVEVTTGATESLAFSLARLLSTPDALSADFHIHSARSLDSSATPESRVVVFAAEGVEVMVSTDHDFVLDYGPAIDAVGLRRFVTSRVGLEVTTSVGNPPVFPDAVGHLNAWPLTVQPHARKDGAIEDEFVAPNFLYSRLRRAGAEVIQYNHLRAGVAGLGGIGLFNNIGCNRCVNAIDQTCSADPECPAAPAPRRCGCVGYQPDRPLTAEPNDILLDDDVTGDSGIPNPDGLRNIDFDVLEVANGLDPEGLLALRRDWFSLLDQVHLPTPSGPVPFLAGTGVSDSHRNSLESAGYFRTWVLGMGDDPRKLKERRFDRNVGAGRMLASSGPWIELEVRDSASGRRAGIGDELRARSGELALHLRVLAAPWVPVPEVRVIANGVERRRFDAATVPAVMPGAAVPWEGDASDVLRFEAVVPLVIEDDTWLIVEAGAALVPTPTPDPFVSRIVPGFFSHAFTNPVFVDLDGGGFDAPGIATPSP